MNGAVDGGMMFNGRFIPAGKFGPDSKFRYITTGGPIPMGEFMRRSLLERGTAAHIVLGRITGGYFPVVREKFKYPRAKKTQGTCWLPMRNWHYARGMVFGVD